MVRLPRTYLMYYIIAYNIFLLAILLLLMEPTETGYELSIYQNVLIWPFVLLIASGSLGICLVINQYITERKPYSDWYLLGLLLLALIIILDLSLALIRGYVFYSRGDGLTHMGYIRDILLTGYVGRYNYYPITHIGIVITSIISNISPNKLTISYQIVYSIIYFLFVFLFCRKFLQKIGKIGLVALTCYLPILLLYTVSVQPNSFALLSLPLVLYLYHRGTSENSLEYRILLIINLIYITYLHILISFFLIFVFIVYASCGYIYNSYLVKENYRKISKVDWISVITLSVMSLAWFSSSILWGVSIRRLGLWLKGESVSVPIDMANSMLNKAGLSFFDFVSLFLKMFGGNVLLGIIALIGLIHLLKNRSSITNENLFLSVFLISSGILSIILLIAIPTGIDYFRSLRFVNLPLLLVSGYTISTLVKSNVKENYFIFLVLILLIPFILGFLCLHPSPYIMAPNAQVTEMELSGLKWFIDNKDYNASYWAISSKYRFFELLLGHLAALNRKDISISDNDNYIGDHFSKLFSSSRGIKRYLVYSSIDKYLYIDIWPQAKRFTESDFISLEKIELIDKLYSNKDTNIFLLN